MGPLIDASVPVIFYRRQSRRAFFPSNDNRPKRVIPAEDTALSEGEKTREGVLRDKGLKALVRVCHSTKRERAPKSKESRKIT